VTGEPILDLFDPPPEPPEPQLPEPAPVLSVSELNREVRSLLEGAIPPLWIAGEVANWTRARSGHCYFTLKDQHSQIRAVMWRREAARLPLDPEEGMKVRAFGAVTLYEARGEFQFVVRELAGEEGEGLWRLAFQRLKEALEREGLLDPARRRPIPRFPRVVGVVTSPTGAALRDILTVILRRAPWTRVVVRGARVQGEGAALEVADAIAHLAASRLPDVLIVGRGGGSIEDLWAFNEEVVARAIVASPVPVISAVGHETDVTIADLVADLRAPTPSAAAEAAVQDRGAILRLLQAIQPRLTRGLRQGVDARRHHLQVRRERLLARGRTLVSAQRLRLERNGDRLVRCARGLTPPGRLRLQRQQEGLERAMLRLLEARRSRLAAVGSLVETLSPLSTLRRGFAVPLDGKGRLLKGVGAFPPGLPFILRVADGRVGCRVADDQREEAMDEVAG